MPCAARGSSPPVFHKSPEQKAAPAFCVFPVRAAQAARSLPGALSPGVAHLLPSTSPAPVPARAGRVPAPCVLPRPSQWMSTIKNLRRSLNRDWRPVCNVVGAAVLGAEPAPFPSLLPPVSSGAGPVRSLRTLLWTCWVPLFCEWLAVCSGRLISLSLFCCPTVSVGNSQKLPPIALRALRTGPYPKQCRPLLSIPPPLAGGRCGRLGYFSAGSCF